MGAWHQRNHPLGVAIPRLFSFSTLRHSRELSGLTRQTRRVHLAERVTLICLRCRAYHEGSGILTGFPFLHDRLELQLGSTNPQLTSSAEEP